MNIQFKETQKFTQWWLWLILVSIIALFLYGNFKQFYKGIPWGNNPLPDGGLIISTIILLLVFLLFVFMKLTTLIDNEGIVMSFYPFINKKVLWTEVESVNVVNYGFVGGWGIRLFTDYGTVYNIKGNKGLFVKLKNGKRFLIGTQKEEELSKVIEFLG